MKKVKNHKLSLNKIEDVVLLVYLCAAVAHQTGTGFDAIFVRAMFVIYAAVVLLQVLLNSNKLVINGYIIWQVVFFGYILLSCFWADSNYSTYYFTQFIQILFLAISLPQRIKSISDVRLYLQLYYMSLIYMIILLYIKSPASDWGTESIGSALGLWRNAVGIYTATGFLLGIYFFQNSSKKVYKIINLLAIIAFAYVSFVSGSRKSVFMVFAYFIIYFILYKKRNLKEVKSLIKLLVGLVAVVLIVYFAFKYLMESDLLVAKRLASMLDIFFGSGSGNEGSIQERNYYIEMAQRLFSNNVVFGAGSNGFAAYMDEIGYSHIAYCHNNFWELLSTLGIVGFTIYYSMHFLSLCRAFPLRKNMQSIRPLAAVLWISLAVTIIFGWWMVYYVNVSDSYMFVLVYMLGYIKCPKKELVRLKESSRRQNLCQGI